MLREKIASLFAVARRAGAEAKPGDPEEFADLVLAIPEIREALKINYLVKAGAIVNAGTKV